MSTSEEIMNKIEKAREISFKQPSHAFEMGKEAYNEAKSQGFKLEEAKALFVMSLSCRSMTKLNDCFDYAFDALKLFEECNDLAGIAGAMNLMGVVYFYYAMYDQALELFIKALNITKNSDDYIIMSRIMNNMGEVYREVGNLDEALASYSKALDICRNNNFTANAAVIFENMGEVFYKRKEYYYSLECYKKSYEILQSENMLVTLAEVENKIGKIHFIQNEYDTARKYYFNALTRLDEIGNKFFSIDVLINIAELEKIEDEELYINYLYRAAEYGEEINARKKLSQVYRLITDYYEHKGDFELALEFYKRFHLIEQEIETTVISHKLEIIKIELSKLLSHEEVEKIKRLNKQLEQDIEHQNMLLAEMEKANRSLQHEAISDDLTNIHNRRGVRDYLASVWKESEARPFDSALLIIDIDYFKRYNDYHGHLEGDACLKRIALCLNKTLGNRSGIVGRYGGEEFVYFIKDIDYYTVIYLAEQLRKSIERLDMNYLWNDFNYPITISIGGVFGYSSNFKSINEMFAIADKELYNAKSEGRNRVFVRNTNIHKK